MDTLANTLEELEDETKALVKTHKATCRPKHCSTHCLTCQKMWRARHLARDWAMKRLGH